MLWLAEGGERSPARLCVAPLQVWGPMRDKLLADKTVVLTSATLMLGGDFSALATSVGLRARRAGRWAPRRRGPATRTSTTTRCRGAGSTWGRRSTTRQQAILYVARHLPPPGRDGLGEAQIDEIVRAGGRRRGPHAGSVLLAPGRGGGGRGGAGAAPAPDHLGPGRGAAARAGPAVRGDPHTCLFGTLSLWQGLDVPGRHLPAGAHRPDPVPAPRRPADVGPAASRRPGRRQRVHAGRGHACRAAARAGQRAG